MLKHLSAAPLLLWAIYPTFAHERYVGQAASLHAPIADQSASSRYEKKDPQEFSRAQIAKDRKDLDARDANGRSMPNGNESNAAGASDGAEGHSSAGAPAVTGTEAH